MVGGLVIAALVAVAVVASVSNRPSPGHSQHVAVTQQPAASTTSTTSRAQAIAKLLSDVTVTPPNGTRKQPLQTVVTVRAAGAQLVAVEVTKSPGNNALAGTLDERADEWRSTGALFPGSVYTVTYRVDGAGGLSAEGSSRFETAPPAEVVTASVFPPSGIQVGVGQPIVITFSHPINSAPAQQGVLSRFTIAMSKPVPGGWHWFSSVELHFRPSSYWPVGEQVRLSADLDRWDIGGGAWGQGQVSTAFVVGDSHISTVDLATHQMVVTDNGQAIYDWPVSAGRAQYPSMDGTHIVLDRESVVRMDSASVGIPVHSPNGYDELVYWDVHIADSGEYVHAAPWDVSIQGFQNVSHGCINLSPARAETFFRFSRAGDIVKVVNGPRAPVMGDHGVIDWSFGPSLVNWTPAKVVALTAPVTLLPTTTLPPPAGVPYFGPTVPPAPTTTSSPPTTTPPTTAATTTATTTLTTPSTAATSATAEAPNTTTTSTAAVATTALPTSTAATHQVRATSAPIGPATSASVPRAFATTG
jgi:lipoprotein-anchoring transpeptidase ErfK/SrfK